MIRKCPFSDLEHSIWNKTLIYSSFFSELGQNLTLEFLKLLFSTQLWSVFMSIFETFGESQNGNKDYLIYTSFHKRNLLILIFKLWRNWFSIKWEERWLKRGEFMGTILTLTYFILAEDLALMARYSGWASQKLQQKSLKII